MTIRQKSLIYLIAQVVFTLILVVFVFYQVRNISGNIQNELPQDIATLNQSVYVKYLAEKTLFYDEVLTQSVRNFVFTQDELWKNRYTENEALLDKLIKDAKSTGTFQDQENFEKLSQVNIALVDLEYTAFHLVDAGANTEALHLLDSDNYWNLKLEYVESMRDYMASKDREIDKLMQKMQELVESHSESQASFLESVIAGISGYTALTLAFTWISILFFGRQIVSNITLLRYGARRIEEGDFDYKINVNSKDEFQDLAQGFNAMAVNLKVMTEEITENRLKEQLEKQRQKFSRDLHDHLGILISSLKIQLERLKPAIADKYDSVYREIVKLLNETYSQVRELANNPVPGTIADKGLKVSLSELCSRTQMIFELNVSFITNLKEADFTDDQKTTIYSMIRELMNNTVKHANATKIDLQVIRHDDQYVIMYEDNGKGFDPEILERVEGKGHKNIQMRVAQIAGNLHIDSQKGRGTTITVEIPATTNDRS